eukprot:365127-Chlamydomonas_euryale.AAC.4
MSSGLCWFIARTSNQTYTWARRRCGRGLCGEVWVGARGGAAAWVALVHDQDIRPEMRGEKAHRTLRWLQLVHSLRNLYARYGNLFTR